MIDFVVGCYFPTVIVILVSIILISELQFTQILLNGKEIKSKETTARKK